MQAPTDARLEEMLAHGEQFVRATTTGRPPSIANQSDTERNK